MTLPTISQNKKIKIMKTKYSKTPFDGFTHRFKVEFETGDRYSSNLDIYANSSSYSDLEKFINENKSEKVKSFKIVHRASKEEDELSSKLIDEMFDTKTDVGFDINTTEGARAYLESEGIDPDKCIEEGLAEIEKVKARIKKK